MTARPRAFSASAALVAIVLLAANVHLASPNQGSGAEWLSWSPEVRSLFVRAHLQGFFDGKTAACNAADSLFELNKPVRNIEDTVSARCFRHAKSYSRAPDHYVNVITDFYQKYPRYRTTPYAYLIFHLTDDGYKTAEELYRAALDGKIRTTF